MISNMCLKFRHSHVSIIIMLFLLQCFNSSSSSSSNSTTPGFHANQLVAVADNGMNKQIKCTDKERHALLDFKAGLQDPRDCLSTWGTKEEDVDDDCCKWMGVKCNNQTGHVAELDIKTCYLEGGEITQMIPSLLNLTYLTLLDLSHNSFNGTIPASIGSLTELKYLDLSSNSFSGTIPVSIGSLTELWYLDLSASSLSGTIPESIGSMTELTALHLASNSLSGSIPESIGSLTKLRELYLGYNLFNGSIPKSIGSLTELWKLDLSYNSFSGNVPKSIGSLTKLRDLSLSYNSFSGTIPREFGNLVNLESLRLDDLRRCSVENIRWLSRLSHLENLGMSGISLAKADHWVNAILSLQNLTWLVLDGCNLSQVMHPYYSSSSHVNSSSSNIVNLYLSNNNLNSSIYSWLYLLTSNRLEYLDLSGNKLDEIPKYLGNLCSLSALNFQNNSALVPFSDFLKNLSAGCTSYTLQSLHASRSQLTGSIPDDEIQKFSSLGVLDLAHNKLNGTISEKIWELPMLDRLDISSNSLSGAIFEKTGKLKPAYIDFSNNLLQGVFSDSFYGPVTNVSSTLNILNLSRNKLYGGISFLCHIVDGSLTYLDLSHNSFSGQIPDCLWHSIELRVLNLAHNNLSGRLPASIKHLFQLEVLYLYNNNFSGELPLSLGNCTKITFLDLGANKFSGNVPIWIAENLSGLYVLNLGTNNFFGPIPLQFCQLVNLQILDFSVNSLNGTIPSCVNNLTSLVHEGFLPAHDHRYYIRYKEEGYEEYNYYTDRAMVQWQGIRREFTNNLRLLTSIDLSSNNLTGRIPNELTDLRGLLALNLSKNALYGEIPQKIAQVKELLTLDLSRNHFSGRIPPSLSEITSLNCLDLSYNNLSGKIPSGNQLRTFEASSYTGNAGLCGLPLSKYCPGYEKLPVPSPVREGDIDELERWFYIGGAIGFAIGFWTVCSILLINRRGRHTFFHFLGTLEDWVFVKVVVCKGKFQVIAQ